MLRALQTSRGGPRSLGAMITDPPPGVPTQPTPVLMRQLEPIGSRFDITDTVFLAQDGMNGAAFKFSELGGSGSHLGNSVWNLTGHGYASLIQFHRHDDAAVVTSGTKSVVTGPTANAYQAFGRDIAHLGGTRGSFWLYSAVGNQLFVNYSLVSNGGYVLVAVDNQTAVAFGPRIKTVTPAMVAPGQAFDNAMLSALPAPWNALGTLVGCTYLDCRPPADDSANRLNQWTRVFAGEQGSHTLKLAPTGTNRTLSGTSRDYISAFGFTSQTQSPIVSQLSRPEASGPTSGFTVAVWMPTCNELSMHEMLEQYQPLGASAQFVGGNHTDGGVLSQESADTGAPRAFGQSTAGSATLTGLTSTAGIETGRKLLLWNSVPEILTVDSVSGTSVICTSPAARSSFAPIRISVLAATASAATNSLSLTVDSVASIREGGLITVLAPGGWQTREVRAVTGLLLTLDRAVTCPAGTGILVEARGHRGGVWRDGGVPIGAAPGQLTVCETDQLGWSATLVRSHPQLGAATTTAAAAGASALNLDSVGAGFRVGQMVGIYGPDQRQIARIVAVSGSTISIDQPVSTDIPAGVRVAPGLELTLDRRFGVRGAGMTTRSELRGYLPGDTLLDRYDAMLVAQGSTLSLGRIGELGRTGDSGASQPVAWQPGGVLNSATFPASFAGLASADGICVTMRWLGGPAQAFHQSRPGTSLFGEAWSKLYLRAISNGRPVSGARIARSGWVLQIRAQPELAKALRG